MDFQNWGEDPFIEYVAKRFSSKEGIVGIGDDCAVIPADHGKSWLVTTDAMVEGVHFLKDQIPPQDLGYKIVAVNVSDIAAMGGLPKYGFLSIALPKFTENSWISLVIEGVKEACDKWGIALLGGDTVGSKRDIFLNMTLIGTAEKIKYRNTAEEGDIICVSGYLGDSGGGLKALQEGIRNEKLIHSHYRPQPSVERGMELAAREDVHAMMDISDGLDCDLKRLLKSSQKGAVIELSKLPISNELSEFSEKYGWDPLQFALAGGEDYCLLFTVTREALNELSPSLFPIGTITKEGLIYQKEGKDFPINYPTYNHFT